MRLSRSVVFSAPQKAATFSDRGSARSRLTSRAVLHSTAGDGDQGEGRTVKKKDLRSSNGNMDIFDGSSHKLVVLTGAGEQVPAAKVLVGGAQ